MRSLISSLLVLLGLHASAGDALAERFANPPEATRLQAWYHWVGDCVTEEGLAADLKAMGEMEIGTAHVFMPSMAHLPVTAKPLTPEWFTLWRAALREAKKNNIKLGFHNCPGWSSSGGPWITPENSMKMLVASETDYDPAARKTATLPLAQPLTLRDFYRDVAVMAFPITRPPRLVRASGDFPGDFEGFRAGTATLTLPLDKVGATCALTLEYDRPASPATAILTMDETHFYMAGDIAASPDGRAWTTCTTWRQELFNAQKTPKTMRLATPPQNARFFRVTFRATSAPPWVGVRSRKLKAFSFSELPYVENLDARNSAATTFGYAAPRDPAAPGISQSAFVDLTPAFKGGALDLAALGATLPPDKVWRILRIGYTTTGKHCAPATLSGLECDKLSKKGLDAHWPNMPQRLLAEPDAKGIVSISIVDSYEVGGQNWTEAMPDEFRARRGYDLRPWLPAFAAGYVVGTAGETAKALFDFQRTVADLFAENYYDYFAELCHRAGIEAACEPYGGPFDNLRCGARADVPTGEFWLGRAPHNSPRIAASIGHLNGRARIAAESFTTEAKEGRWQITPSELRRSGDAGWLNGISQIVYHSYLHQPFKNVVPGLSLGRHGTQLNRNTTWWAEGVHWSRYVRRGQVLLQSGAPRAELLLFSGDARPNAYRYAADVVAAGGNFDYVGASNLPTLSVAPDGRLVAPGGATYDALYLDGARYILMSSLREIKRLVDAGARVAGAKPLASPSLADDPATWTALSKAIWADGRVKGADSSFAALKAFGIRTAVESNNQLHALHRVIDGRDVYFVVNARDAAFRGGVSFAAAGAPERWDARDASITPLAVVKGGAEAGRVRAFLDLPAHGSCFVVFDPKKQPAAFVDDVPVVCADVRILSARYAAKADATRGRDVADVVRRLLAKGETTFTVTNAALGGDPASKCPKALTLVYTVDGERHEQTVPEFATVSLRFMRKVAPKPETVLADLSTDWTIVSFKGPNAPASPRALAKLASWSDSDDPKLRYFAGRAVYEKTVTMPANAKGGSVLDLGTVRDVVNVWANGRALGCLWEAPYRIALPSDLAKPGARIALKIEVVNTWPNRLIGDDIARKAGAKEEMSPRGPWPQWVLDGKADSGTGIYTWSNFRGWTAEEPLLSAGLIGPVRLLAE